MALGIIASSLFKPNYIKCQNHKYLRVEPRCVHKSAGIVDLLLGITLLIVAILALTGKIPLTQGKIYAMIAIGVCEVSPYLGRLFNHISHHLLHCHTEPEEVPDLID